MLWIACPNCGARPVDEYVFGGEISEGAAPGMPERVTDPAARNVDHVWFFDNLDGPSIERWFHDAGCRRWLTLLRDTHTDSVLNPEDH